MLNSTWIHGINPLWSWCIIFIIYLVLVSSYFVLEYRIYDHIWTWPILFCLCGFICFWNQYFTSLIKWARKLLLFFYFLKVLFLKSLIELIWKAIWGFWAGEGLSAIISVSLVPQVLFSVSSDPFVQRHTSVPTAPFTCHTQTLSLKSLSFTTELKSPIFMSQFSTCHNTVISSSLPPVALCVYLTHLYNPYQGYLQVLFPFLSRNG